MPVSKRPKTPKARTHLPALTPAALAQLKATLAAMPNISAAGKKAALESIQAATNPDSEGPLTVIKTLSKDEQQRVHTAIADYAKTMGAMNARGRAALQKMSEEEWQKAVDEANKSE